jgi:hypothetical protein
MRNGILALGLLALVACEKVEPVVRGDSCFQAAQRYYLARSDAYSDFYSSMVSDFSDARASIDHDYMMGEITESEMAYALSRVEFMENEFSDFYEGKMVEFQPLLDDMCSSQLNYKGVEFH